MTYTQYQREVGQNALLDHKSAKTEQEMKNAISLFTLSLNPDKFWTEERIADYMRYVDAPNGAVCPMFKEQ